jgi:RNA polymerase sigma-70 factor (ECF subfamily)
LAKAEPQARRVEPKKGDLQGVLTPELLVRKYASAVLGVCLAHTRNLHDGEDVMQDVFLKACSKLHTLKDPDRARAWLLQIARRTCIDHQRRRPPAVPLASDVSDRAPYDDEQVKHLHAAISRLPEDYREPITLYYLNGRSCASLAKNLGISQSAVRSRLARARLRLHEILQEDSL